MAESAQQLIRITSWNVAGKDPLPEANLNYLFDDARRNLTVKPQIQIVGLQEAPQYLFSDPWTENLSSTLRKRGYILFKHHKLSGILLYIFVLREMILQMRDFETESVKTGFGGLLGNKGGVSLRFTFNGNSFCATNSHLAAHQDNLQQRIQDYKSIRDNTKFRIDPNTSDVLTHEYSFWFGDLNFRLDSDKNKVLDTITQARSKNSTNEQETILSSLHAEDQLIKVRKEGEAFTEFNETKPKFLPTYKYKIGIRDVYDSDNRIPSWTDRILFRHHETSVHPMTQNFKPSIKQIFFDCIPEPELSDHKPVASLFEVTTFNQNRSTYEVVKFENIIGWKANEDGRLWYKISNENFCLIPKVLSSWDHIALYEADFTSLEKYLTIVSVNNIARNAPNVNAMEVPYHPSSPSSRTSSPTRSRRGSASSSSSDVSYGIEATTLNDAEFQDPSSSTQFEQRVKRSSRQTVCPILDDAMIGDGFKYFTATFLGDLLLPNRKYVVLYLKTNAASEYDVYGMSNEFEVSS